MTFLRQIDMQDANPLIGGVPGQDPVSATIKPAATDPNVDRFTLVSTRRDFDALDGEWTALFDRAGTGRHVFQSFNWLWHWCNHYLGVRDTLAIVTVRREGRLVMVWPLIISPCSGACWLLWMGDPVSQYGDILAEDMPDQRALMRRAFDFAVSATGVDAIELRKVRTDATVAPLMIERGMRITGSEEAPFTDLAKAGSFDALEQRFTTKTRKNRQRQRRRLEERGAITCDVAQHGGAARDAIAACMTFKRAWLSSKGLVSRALADARVEAFFSDAASSEARPCGVSVSTLRSGGEIADISISVSAKGTRALHMIAYGLKFERFAPGALHLDDAFRRACADGISRLDFLSPRHPYKMEWADETIAVHDHAQAITPRGKVSMVVCIDILRNGSKAVLARLPSSVRTIVASAHKTLAQRGG
jgi:CelD/BcsL family acetyltransferase involved in cellulose biosynthesis